MPQVDLNDFAAGLEHVVHDRGDLGGRSNERTDRR